MLNHRHTHPRERLAAVFWAEYPTATSRAYLRNCLWRLREALSDAGARPEAFLRCEDSCLSFCGSGRYWLDVEAFEEAVTSCRDVPGGRLAPEQARSLQEADNLYAGDLLEETYDDWCLYDRERLRLLYLDLLRKLLAYHEGAGTHEQGLDYAQRILARDPTCEQVHRQAMRLHWLMGDPVEALAQYRCCVQVLSEELGTKPAAKTSSLYQQMLHNRYGPKSLPVHRQNGLPQRLPQQAASRPIRERLLDRLHQLEAVMEETGAELHEVRRLMEKALILEGQDP
jgi:DNA-binding SARP family transcriptional activator